MGTDALLSELCELHSVQGLSLAESGMTDVGMAAVRDLKGLEYLNLNSTAVTDAGLRQFEGMSRLEFLNLGGCPGVTDEGVARLKQALPKCEIIR
jgi:internalin A